MGPAHAIAPSQPSEHKCLSPAPPVRPSLLLPPSTASCPDAADHPIAAAAASDVVVAGVTHDPITAALAVDELPRRPPRAARRHRRHRRRYRHRRDRRSCRRLRARSAITTAAPPCRRGRHHPACRRSSRAPAEATRSRRRGRGDGPSTGTPAPRWKTPRWRSFGGLVGSCSRLASVRVGQLPSYARSPAHVRPPGVARGLASSPSRAASRRTSATSARRSWCRCTVDHPAFIEVA